MGASDFVLAKQKLEPLIVFETIVWFINVPFFFENADAAFFRNGYGLMCYKKVDGSHIRAHVPDLGKCS